MIHVMNFKGEIVDFISHSDSVVTHAIHKRDINERMETFEFEILSDRTTHMHERNRIIIQDKNGQYREFIIDRISEDIDGYTEVETVASYLEDITKARPYAPGKLEKMTTKQALSDVLKDTGWEVSDSTEFGGLRTTSWTSYQTRYDVLLQLCTTYEMMADFYIEVGSNRVDNRLVVLRKRNPLFKGKEIEYGKDLIGLKRTVDFSEIKTALLCVGPEPEEGKNRLELVVKDDEAQAKYGLPGRYNWGVYEPESSKQNMTELRLRTLGTTELNKRKSEVITYEVTAVDIEKEYKHEIVNLGDKVRIKDREFTPPLYVEAEVISEEYDLISEDATYNFGEYKEFKESDLRSSFDRKLDAIRQKVTDGFSNVNTIVRESLEGELQHFERKILKGDTPPENPVNDLLWLDTSNPKVAVLRRYWNGEWIKSSAENAEDVGAVTREQALYSELSNTFVNLTIQHSRLMHEVSDVLESEYLIDTDIKEEVNSKLNDTIGVFNTIKSNLDSMTSETATIGKLVDTQALFLEYREKMQALYNTIENAKIAIDERFKLLQSQYTDEKYNEAMEKIASILPGGIWNPETKQLTGNIPNEERLNELEIGLQETFTSQINGANQILKNQVDAQLLQLKDEITLSVRSVNEKIEQKSQESEAYAEQQKQEAIDTSNKALESVKIRTTQAENSIKVLQDSLLLTATKTDVQRTLDEQLKPLKNEVNEQKAQLQIMSDSIDSKVSKSEYTTDKDGIVERLNSADTQRQQLSNQISDRVTISEYKNGIEVAETNAKEHTDKKIDAMQIGNLNLIRSYKSNQNATNGIVKDDYEVILPLSRRTDFNFYGSNNTLEPDTDYVLKIHESSEDVEMGVFYNQGRNTVSPYSKNKIVKFNTGDKTDFKIVIIARSDNQRVGKVSLYKGTKELDWTPNPEDVNAKIDQAKAGAEKSSKAYTDDKVQQVNQTLSTYETRLTQNGKDIALRATQEELNASKKTLSRVIADLTVNTTTGLTMTYDENGAIQSHTIGPDGIKLKGDRVDIAVNKDFNVLVNNVSNKADETNIVNKLNLSREGLDINVNNVGIRGGDSREYVHIKNDEITLYGTYTRNWVGETETNNVFTRLKDGHIRFRNNDKNRSIYISDLGISTFLDGTPTEASGTIQFFDYLYDSNARGLTIRSGLGVLGLRSENNKIVMEADDTVNIGSNKYSIYLRPFANTRSGVNEFQFYVKDNDNPKDTDGVLLFGELSDPSRVAGSGIRFRKQGVRGSENISEMEPLVYATNNIGDIGSGSFYANNLYGNLRAKTTNQYALVAYDGEFRVTDKNGATGSSINYRPIRVSEIKTTEGGAFSNHSGKNVYFGVGYNELRITANDFYNGGNTKYQDIRFKNWSAMSHEKYKYDIEEWDYNVLDVFKSELQLHCYKVNSEAATKYARIHHGIVLRDNSNLDKFPVEWRNGDGFDGNEIMFWNTKAIQELVFKIEEQNEKINKLEEQLNEQTTS